MDAPDWTISLDRQLGKEFHMKLLHLSFQVKIEHSEQHRSDNDLFFNNGNAINIITDNTLWIYHMESQNKHHIFAACKPEQDINAWKTSVDHLRGKLLITIYPTKLYLTVNGVLKFKACYPWFKTIVRDLQKHIYIKQSL